MNTMTMFNPLHPELTGCFIQVGLQSRNIPELSLMRYNYKHNFPPRFTLSESLLALMSSGVAESL